MIVSQNFGILKTAQDANYNMSGGVDQTNNQLGELIQNSDVLNALIQKIAGDVTTLQAQIMINTNPNATAVAKNFITVTILPNLYQLQEEYGKVTANLNQFKATMETLQNSIKQSQAAAQNIDQI